MITVKQYKAIKILQSGGAKPGEAADYMGIAANIVGRAFASENYDEFRNSFYVSTATARQSKNKETQNEAQEILHKVEIHATHYVMEEMKKQTELLTLISNKLAFIVDKLT